jgi:predicted PurR-regulated permease PerM
MVIVAPAVFVSQRLFAELSEALRAVGTDLSSASLHIKVRQFPRVANILEWMETRLNLEQQIQAATGAAAGTVAAWVSGSVWVLTQVFLAFLTLFYFFRDRAGLLQFFRRLIPLPAPEIDEIFDRIAKTVNTALYRNLLVKLIQGFLGGLMFWILGLPAPVLCGAAMALFAVLPVMGTAIVWAPGAIFLALSGSWVKASVLAVWGGVVVGLIDNFLYPILVAGELRFHPLAVFFSIFGGLLAFGVAGVVLGPVILAITVALLEIWQARRDGKIQTTED